MASHCLLCWNKVPIMGAESLSPEYPKFKLCRECSSEIHALKSYINGDNSNIEMRKKARKHMGEVLARTSYIEIKNVLSALIEEYDRIMAPYLEEENRAKEENKYKGIIFVCPKCGNIYPNTCTTTERSKITCACGLPLVDQIKTNYTLSIYDDMDIEQQKEWEDMLRKRYVTIPGNSLFDQSAYYLREDEDFKRNLEIQNKIHQQLQAHQVTCPKCGSTNFTPIRKKWDPITGFMTNKVDMVCNGCGWVKKG